MSSEDNSKSYNELLDAVSEIVSGLNEMVENNLDHYRDQVDFIIENEVKDRNKIGLQLDYMLDIAFNDEILLLYKKLCRYVYRFDPQMAADYVRYYFEEYEEDKLNDEKLSKE